MYLFYCWDSLNFLEKEPVFLFWNTPPNANACNFGHTRYLMGHYPLLNLQHRLYKIIHSHYFHFVSLHLHILSLIHCQLQNSCKTKITNFLLLSCAEFYKCYHTLQLCQRYSMITTSGSLHHDEFKSCYDMTIASCQIFQIFLFLEQRILRNYLRKAIFQIILSKNW